MKQFKFFLMALVAVSVLFSACSSDDKDDVLQSDAKAITAFSINTLSAQISESDKTIKLTMPFGTDVSKLSPSVKVSDKATVTPKSDDIVDFTKPVTYKVTAEDGSKAEYTVTLTVAKASDAKLLTFSFAGLDPKVDATVDEDKKTVNAVVPHGTDVTALVPTVSIVGASVTPASEIAQDFTKTVTYTVVAEDETKVAYVVTVVIAEPVVEPEITEVSPKTAMLGTAITIKGTFLAQGNVVVLKDFTGKEVINLTVKEESATTIVASIPEDDKIVEGEYIAYVTCGEKTVSADNLNRVTVIKNTLPKIVSMKSTKLVHGKDAISLTTVNVPNSNKNSMKFKMEGASESYYSSSFYVSNNGTAVSVDYTDNLKVGKQVLYLDIDGVVTNEVTFEVVANTNPVPTITSVTPVVSKRDDLITIYGTNLGDIFNTKGLVYYEVEGEYRLLSEGLQIQEWGDGFVKIRPNLIPARGTGKFKVQVRVDGKLSEFSQVLEQLR